jgi:uncharacterized protein YjbJ (UPF0337 family)
MEREEFEGHWHLLRSKVQERWGKFTDSDIAKINGKYEQFVGLLQNKYGFTKEQAERELKNWHDNNPISYQSPWREKKSEKKRKKA